MSRPIDFGSSLAKFWRGVELVEELNTHIVAWSDFETDPPVVFRQKRYPKKHLIEFWVEHVKPVSPDWSLILGDALNNFRAALDHLAWQLYVTGDAYPLANPGDEVRIQFPRYWSNKPDFLKRVVEKELPGVSKRRLLRLSPFQPYASRKGGGYPAIPVLADLANADKHRELLLTVCRPRKAVIYHPGGAAERVEWVLPPKAPFEPDTEVARVHYWPSADLSETGVKVDLKPSVAIALEQGLWLEELLTRVEWTVTEVIGVLSSPQARAKPGQRPHWVPPWKG
jgi:hypothetical protein